MPHPLARSALSSDVTPLFDAGHATGIGQLTCSNGTAGEMLTSVSLPLIRGLCVRPSGVRVAYVSVTLYSPSVSELFASGGGRSHDSGDQRP